MKIIQYPKRTNFEHTRNRGRGVFHSDGSKCKHPEKWCGGLGLHFVHTCHYENSNDKYCAECSLKLALNALPDECVYIIQGPQAVYKIGKTKRFRDRLHTFEVKLPFDVVPALLIGDCEIHSTEKQLHELLRSRRVNGEWYNLAAHDFQTIESFVKNHRH